MKTFTACQHGVPTESNRGFNKAPTNLIAAESLGYAIKRNRLCSSSIVSAAVLSIGLLLSSNAAAEDVCDIQADTVICTYDEAGPDTFKVPTGVGVSEITVELWGAGGGGADGPTSGPSRGGPGGGGGYLQKPLVSVTVMTLIL